MGTPLKHVPASNTEAVITITAVGGVALELENVSWSYDDDPTGGVLTVESPALTVLQSWKITKGGPGILDFSGSCIKGAVGEAMVVRLTAGGSGISGTVNAIQRS